MPDVSVTVIVVEYEDASMPLMFATNAPKNFFAYMASNPQIRADGETEEKALESLKALIMNSHSHQGVKRKKAVDLRLDELIVEEVMLG